MHDSGLSGLQKGVAIAYPLGDVLVLAMLARMLAPGMGRSRSAQILTVDALAVLASDTAYGLIELHGIFHNGTVVDLGWAVFYGGWGAAALHPTMTEVTQPVTRLRAEVNPGQAGDPADARLADRPGRSVRPVVPVPRRRPRRDRGVLRDPLPAGAVPAVGRGRLAPTRGF